MPNRKARAAAAAASLAALFSSSAATAQPMQPVKPWVLDYAEAQCLATRVYGDPAAPTVLGLRPAPNGETFEFLVGRTARGPEFAEQLEGSVDFGGSPIKAWLLRYRAPDGQLDIYQFRIGAAEMARGRAAQTVTFRAKGAADVQFSLTSVAALLDGLDRCTADLKRHWNMDGTQISHVAAPAQGDLRKVFTADDYPYEAVRRGLGGRSRFLLLINEKGAVAACHVLSASGVPSLDAMGCAAIKKRAEFKPALDRQGRPVRSAVVSPEIVWRIGSSVTR